MNEFFNILPAEGWGFIIIGTVVILLIVWIVQKAQGNSERNKLIQLRPGGTDIKYAGQQNRRSASDWSRMPAAIDIPTITRELGWTPERYRIYQERERAGVLSWVPDFKNELHPEEIIIKQSYISNSHEGGEHDFVILLTDKRLLYNFEEKQDNKVSLQWTASHWYVNIIEVSPIWEGDLGSHVEGGGGYMSGWVWEGSGSAFGIQDEVKTIQHKMNCKLTIREKNGDWQSFPEKSISSQQSLDKFRDFIGTLDKLVNLAWKNIPGEKTASSRGESPGTEEEADDYDKRIALLERYGVLREKGLITEEEYNRQKKNILRM